MLGLRVHTGNITNEDILDRAGSKNLTDIATECRFHVLYQITGRPQ